MIKTGFAVFGLALLATYVYVIKTQSNRGGADRAAEFQPVRMRRPLPAVIGPPVLPASKMSSLGDEELVLGLEINGEARAYPVNFISEPDQEVINDVLGEAPIAVTWCDRCKNGVVFDRRLDGKTITLQVAGMLWHDNMVMVDGTGSLWSQFLGKAMRGIRKGKSLIRIPCAVMQWRNWKRNHPETSVVNLRRTSSDYRSAYLVNNDDLVFGIHRGYEPRAWRLFDLSATNVVNDWIGERETDGSESRVAVVVAFLPAEGTLVLRTRRVNHRDLTFVRNGRNEIVDRETGTVWNLSTGKAVSGTLAGSSLPLLPGMLVRDRNWRLFRPESTYWTPAAKAPRS